MNSCGDLASQRTRDMGSSPGQMLSSTWQATAPDAVSSILDTAGAGGRAGVRAGRREEGQAEGRAEGRKGNA